MSKYKEGWGLTTVAESKVALTLESLRKCFSQIRPARKHGWIHVLQNRRTFAQAGRSWLDEDIMF